MKAQEIMVTFDENGKLLLDEPLKVDTTSRVKVIVLFTELFVTSSMFIFNNKSLFFIFFL